MSAFKNTNRTPKTFASIVNGKWSINAKEGDVAPDGTAATRREYEDKQTKEKKFKWEFLYEEVTGMLESIKVVKSDLTNTWYYEVTLDNAGDKSILSIPAEGQYGDSFASKVRNIAPNTLTTIRPYNFLDKEKKDAKGQPKKNVGVTVEQGGVKLPSAFSKDNPGDQPEWPAKGASEEDWKIFKIKLNKFYRNIVAAWADNAPTAVAHEDLFPAGEDADPFADMENDLPFK